MSQRNVLRGAAVGLLLGLLSHPALAAEYEVWDFASAPECDIGGTSDWGFNIYDEAPWYPSWDGTTWLQMNPGLITLCHGEDSWNRWAVTAPHLRCDGGEAQLLSARLTRKRLRPGGLVGRAADL